MNKYERMYRIIDHIKITVEAENVEDADEKVVKYLRQSGVHESSDDCHVCGQNRRLVKSEMSSTFFKNERFVESLIINGKLVNVFEDDYGQPYFGQYVNDKGEIKEIACGTYNIFYIDEIAAYFDVNPKNIIHTDPNVYYDLLSEVD